MVHLSCKIKKEPITYIKYMRFTTIHLKINNVPFVFRLTKNSIDAELHFDHGKGIRCDI
jgi:hypothetical protein